VRAELSPEDHSAADYVETGKQALFDLDPFITFPRAFLLESVRSRN
jgi:hypothetical protein